MMRKDPAGGPVCGSSETKEIEEALQSEENPTVQFRMRMMLRNHH